MSKQHRPRPYRRWTSLKNPAAFSNFDAFFRANRFAKEDKENVKTSLMSHPAFAVSRNYKKKFVKRSNVAFDFGRRWEADIGDIGENTAWNDKPVTVNKNNRLFFLAIDLFSKQLFCQPLPSKSSKRVTKAWAKILDGLKPPQHPPQILCTDKGKEFLNRTFQSECEKRGITLRTSSKRGKNSGVERLMLSFKRVVVLYAETHRHVPWPQVLLRVTQFLNNRYHRTIDSAPNQVAQQWRAVQDVLWRRASFSPLKTYLALQRRADEGGEITDGGRTFWIKKKVLIPYDKSRMDKATKRNFKYKPYFISFIDTAQTPFLYKVKDKNGKPGKRYYYAKELKDAAATWSSPVPTAGAIPAGRGRYKLRLRDHGAEFDKLVRGKPDQGVPTRKSEIPRSSSPIRRARDKPGHRRKRSWTSKK
jgi:transposase InsO family protein